MKTNMRSDWRKTNYLRILGIIVVGVGIGIVLWQIPFWIEEHPYENWSPLYYGFVVCVAGLIALIFSQDIRDRRSIFVVQLMAYFGLYLAIRAMYVFVPISLSLYLAIAALFIGLIHFIFSLLLRRTRIEALFSALKIFLFFSAYSMFFYGQFEYGESVFSLFPLYSDRFIPLVAVSTVAIFPEIFGFVALYSVRKKRILLCVISGAIAVFLLLELSPVRNAFIHAIPWDFPGGVSISGSYGQPIGKQDVEQEFVRSLSIIDRLVAQANSDPVEDLTAIIFNRPKLKEYPMMMNRKWLSEYMQSGSFDDWPEFFAQFFNQELLKLNLRRDSDNDGLGDFLEATLLCDADDPDTDNDGIDDSEDSDPRHAYKESIYGRLNAAIISFYQRRRSPRVNEQPGTRMRVFDGDTVFCDGKKMPFAFIHNEFPRGHGEIANFAGHVLILDKSYIDMWNKIFGSYFSHGGGYCCIEKHILSTFRLFAVLRVSIDSDAGGFEAVYLTVNWREKWFVVAENALTIWLR